VPVLNCRVSATRQAADDEQVGVSPAIALHEIGPRIQVMLLPLEAHRRALEESGKPLPQPVIGDALLDTGASVTCVDKVAANRANLAMVDSGPITSATHDREVVPIFAGRIEVPGPALSFESHTAYGANLAPQGLVALIGRDVLSNCVLIYNGPDGSFTLSL